MQDETTLARLLRARPTDEETARKAVRPYRGLDAGQRLDALAVILESMDVLLAGDRPRRSRDDTEFWRHWKDPDPGRTR